MQAQNAASDQGFKSLLPEYFIRILIKMKKKKLPKAIKIEYDQDIPQSLTTDEPMAP